MELTSVLAQRLATQGLTTSAHGGVPAAVHHLLAVQAQDAPLARWSLAMRTGRPGDPAICGALDSGAVLRTHVLRPTWHYVAAEDIRWLLALTSSKVMSGMAARRRSLGLGDPAVLRREVDRVLTVLDGGPMTRRLVQQRLASDELRGERLGSVLMVAELEGLICSGPLARGQHTYALLDDRVPPAAARSRTEAIQALVARFFAGHGPASVAHLVRWTILTGREITDALSAAGDELASVEVQGVPHWFAADAPQHASRAGTLLLPVFDEAYLTYPGSGFPRSAGHPWGARSQYFAEAGGGVVVSDLIEVGWWKRAERGGTMRVTLGLDPALPAGRRRAVEAQALSLATHSGRALEIVLA